MRRGAIKNQDPKTGTTAIALLITAVHDIVVHRPHAVMAARIAAVSNIKSHPVGHIVDQGSHSAPVSFNLAEVRYSPFYTYNLAFEALVDTLQFKVSASCDEDLNVLAEVLGRSRDRRVQVPAVEVR